MPGRGLAAARPLTRVLVAAILVTRVLVERSTVYPNPTLVQALVRDHVAELQQSAEAAALGRQRETRSNRVVDAAKRRTGWLLVDVGLRLATPRRATSHLVPGEQR
jgi:hypothetical protein